MTKHTPSTQIANTDSSNCEYRNGHSNGKWETRWVWATRITIAVLTFLALTVWNDLRAVGHDVAEIKTAVAVQKQQIQEHERRIGVVEDVRSYGKLDAGGEK